MGKWVVDHLLSRIPLTRAESAPQTAVALQRVEQQAV